jgi:hypothetical protein
MVEGKWGKKAWQLFGVPFYGQFARLGMIVCLIT